MKKICALCKSWARIYCESDQASLCWCCDAKVHSANFLVARHSRSLLCHSCQSPTPWSASGEKLGPSTVSICERCVVDSTSDDDDDDREEGHGGNDDDEQYEGDEDGEDGLDLEDDEVGDDNQVVPWSSTPAPPAASSSSSDQFSIADRGNSMKRKRQNVADLSSEDDLSSSPVQRSHRTQSSRAMGGDKGTQTHSLPSRSEAIVDKHNRNRNRNMISGENESTAVVGKSKARRVVGLDLNSPDSS